MQIKNKSPKSERNVWNIKQPERIAPSWITMVKSLKSSLAIPKKEER
jgi:hypothetical protein